MCVCVCVSGFTLVVTPLVSLMEDQIMYLKSINVSAVMLNASSSKVMIGSHILRTFQPGYLHYLVTELHEPQIPQNTVIKMFIDDCGLFT